MMRGSHLRSPPYTRRRIRRLGACVGGWSLRGLDALGQVLAVLLLVVGAAVGYGRGGREAAVFGCAADAWGEDVSFDVGREWTRGRERAWYRVLG